MYVQFRLHQKWKRTKAVRRCNNLTGIISVPIIQTPDRSNSIQITVTILKHFTLSLLWYKTPGKKKLDNYLYLVCALCRLSYREWYVVIVWMSVLSKFMLSTSFYLFSLHFQKCTLTFMCHLYFKWFLMW